MCGAPSAPSAPSDRDIAVQRRYRELQAEEARAGKPRRQGLFSTAQLRSQAAQDPKFEEIGVDETVRRDRASRKAKQSARRASGAGIGGSLVTSAISGSGNGGFGRSVLTGGA